MLRFGSSPLVTRWIVLTLAVSIVAVLDGGFLANALALVPARVWRGEVWRLATWPLIEAGPMALIVTCVVIFRCGSDLAMRWGERRLLRFVLEIVVTAGVVTCVVAALGGHGHLMRTGGWALGDALVIAWARQFPDRALILYFGLLTLRGQQLIAITIGVVVVFAIFVGPIVMAPELVACGIAASYRPGWLRR